MSKKRDRLELIKQIESAAQLYKEKLVGKRFMYVFDGRYIEVIYKKENFRHLTGLETKLSAKQFYKFAASKMLAVNQIGFSPKHPYNLCVRKIKHIGEVATLAGSENFMLEEIKTNTQTYKFGTTDLSFTLCMNREIDEEGNEKSECYVVQSLRDEDCFSKSKGAYVVTHILMRPNDEKKYTELLFMDKSSGMEELTDEIKSMIDESLLTNKNV